MKDSDLIKLINNASSALHEHCDAVQILISWNENGQTKRLFSGNGNWYARQGMAHEFINSDVAQGNAHELGKVLEEKEDEWEG